MKNILTMLTKLSGPISIILGAIGIVTGIYIIGGILGVIGLLFGLSCYADTDNRIVAYIGIFLSLAAVAWTCIFYSIWDSIP